MSSLSLFLPKECLREKDILLKWSAVFVSLKLLMQIFCVIVMTKNSQHLHSANCVALWTFQY